MGECWYSVGSGVIELLSVDNLICQFEKKLDHIPLLLFSINSYFAVYPAFQVFYSLKTNWGRVFLGGHFYLVKRSSLENGDRAVVWELFALAEQAKVIALFDKLRWVVCMARESYQVGEEDGGIWRRDVNWTSKKMIGSPMLDVSKSSLNFWSANLSSYG